MDLLLGEGRGQRTEFQNLGTEGQKSFKDLKINFFFNAFGTDLVQLTHIWLTGF